LPAGADNGKWRRNNATNESGGSVSRSSGWFPDFRFIDQRDTRVRQEGKKVLHLLPHQSGKGQGGYDEEPETRRDVLSGKRSLTREVFSVEVEGESRGMADRALCCRGAVPEFARETEAEGEVGSAFR
jgi:hypothetical protein